MVALGDCLVIMGKRDTCRQLFCSMTILKKNGMNTKERILDCYISLFNKHGVHKVSANRVARELNISPGHLTHFFARRADVEAALVEKLEHVILTDIRSLRARSDPDELMRIQFHLLGSLWNYRFLLQPETAMDESSALRRAFQRMEDLAIQTIERAFRLSVKNNIIHSPIKPNSLRLLAKNTWALWLVPLQSRAYADGGAEAKQGALYECALRQFSLMQFYFKSPKFTLGIRRAIERELR
jgi:AcrR family transcriptional regulator